MKESTIKTACKKKLEDDGYVCWFVHKRVLAMPGKPPIWRNCDIHTIWDVMALKGDEIRLVQYTSKSHVSDRCKKIKAYYKKHSLSTPCEVWGYEGRGKWRVVKLPE